MPKSKKPRKPARPTSVTVRNFYRNFDVQFCRVWPNGHVFLDVREGDLVVRKFYRPRVFKVTGVTGEEKNQRVHMRDEEGGEIWERPAELLDPKLYSIHAIPDVTRPAAAAARVAAAAARVATARDPSGSTRRASGS